MLAAFEAKLGPAPTPEWRVVLLRYFELRGEVRPLLSDNEVYNLGAGAAAVPIYCMNVTYPLIPEEIVRFCAGKRAVLLVEEGQPAYLEDALRVIASVHHLPVEILGKRTGHLPTPFELEPETIRSALRSRGITPPATAEELLEECALLASVLNDRVWDYYIARHYRPHEKVLL